MKISATPEHRADLPVAKNRCETTAADMGFRTILKQTVVGSTAAQRTAAVAQPCAMQPVRPLVTPETESAPPLADRLDGFIDRLEYYRQKLADPQASLASIQPLLNTIAASTEKLAPELERLDEGDPLKDILNRSLVTAALEMTRFNRGDYL